MRRTVVHQRILVFVRHHFVMGGGRTLTVLIVAPEMSICWIVDRLVVVVTDESRPSRLRSRRSSRCYRARSGTAGRLNRRRHHLVGYARSAAVRWCSRSSYVIPGITWPLEKKIFEEKAHWIQLITWTSSGESKKLCQKKAKPKLTDWTV